MKKNILFITIVIILITYSYLQYNENKKYGIYIQEATYKQISMISYAIKSNDQTLNEILDNKTVTYKQVSYLIDNYEIIIRYGQEINRLKEILDNNLSSSELAKVAGLVRSFLEEEYYIYEETECNSTVIIDKNNNDFNIIKDFNNQWLNIINSYENFLKNKDLRKIDENYWKNIITDLEEISKDMLKTQELSIISKGRNKLNILKDYDECIKKELYISSFNAKIYISEYSTASQEQDHLYGAVYDLEFALPVDCKDIFRENIKNKLLIELNYPEEVHYFSGFLSSIGDKPILKNTENGKAYFTTSFSNLISKNEPVQEEDLLKLIDPSLEFQLKISDLSNKDVLLEKTLIIESLN